MQASENTPWRFTRSLVDLKHSADRRAETVSQGLYGESLTVLESVGHWHRVRNRRDGYEGFVEARFVAEAIAAATHQVQSRGTLLFEAPDIKSPLVTHLPYASELALSAEQQGSFACTVDGYYVWSAHCVPLGTATASDLLASAQALFSGTPYLWGGRSPQGCDCSALVQLAAHACGIHLPRDSGDQLAALTDAVSFERRRRNDLVFWKGHVAILSEPDRLWHATAHSLDTRSEPLDAVIERAGPPTAVRRVATLNQAASL